MENSNELHAKMELISELRRKAGELTKEARRIRYENRRYCFADGPTGLRAWQYVTSLERQAAQCAEEAMLLDAGIPAVVTGPGS
ncbi:MAG: hypothetical protein IMZ50_06105 [Candidatus Atribacteria bacterium]|nr:hypothetical protein [Candidatus Atribacteria bacterium]